MKTTGLALGLAALLIMGGCKNNQNQSATAYSRSVPSAVATPNAANTDPEALGRLGAELKSHPKDADRILSQHGMTEVSFEKAIRTVSSNPADSRRYRDAYRKAGA